MAIRDVISRCCDQWRCEGLPLAPPIHELEIRRVWAALDRKLSADVAELYRTVGGFEDYHFDERFFWCLWPWDWLQKRNRENSREGVAFCDHSIEAVAWELRYETAHHSSVWTTYGYKAAPTLELFLERYLENPWQLM